MTLLVGLAVIGVLLVIGGAIAFFAAGAQDAFSKLTTQFKTITENSTAFEAPGSVEVDLKAGGFGVFLPPGNEVNGKRIPLPPAAIDYTISVTDPDGNPVKFEPNRSSRQGTEPFWFFGFCAVPKDGKYTIDVKASDSKTPAAIVVAPGTKEEFEAMAGSVASLGVGALGGCGAICGVVLFLIGAIGALIARKSTPPDPLAT